MFGRRSFVRGLLASPVAAKTAAENIAKNINYSHGADSVRSGGLGGYELDGIGGDEGGIKKITSLDEYMRLWDKEYESRYDYSFGRIRTYDPDILEMRIPWATKSRMQHRRDYQRQRETIKQRISRELKRHGFVRWFMADVVEGDF